MRAILLVVGLAACNIESGLNRVMSPPEAWISSPVSDAVFRQSEVPIPLAGGVRDGFDAPSSLELSWSLDEEAPWPAYASEDGVVFGELPGDLAIGEHTLTLSALDSDGLSASASLIFSMLGPTGAPSVAILSPATGSTFEIGEMVTFLGQASDAASPPELLDFAWSSSLDGALDGAITAGGQSALLASALSLGTHEITLTVTDEDGEQGSASVYVAIAEAQPTDPEDPELPQPGDLIFTEFMVNPEVVHDHNGEWVELYNTSGRTLDLATYSFHDDNLDYWVFDASILVAPGDYVVLCANPYPTQNGGVPCDGWFKRSPMGTTPTSGLGHGYGVAIANNDDELTLTSPAGLNIDLFDYNDTDSDPIEAGMSFGLDPSCLDGVCNDDINNWCVQTTIQPSMREPGTPGLPNDPCP